VRALVEGVAANLAGGTHHASAGRGSGYCVFNDVASRRARACGASGTSGAARARASSSSTSTFHQGDGTASIFAATTERLHAVAARREELSLPQGGQRPRRRPARRLRRRDYLAALDAALAASGASMRRAVRLASTSPAPTRTRATGSAA
jgi:hypothetical protein